MPVLDARKRFGPFELDLRSGELRTNGARVKLQGQPISVLEILLETPGELVTREQIRQRLWSADTFVDFDHNLNTAIKKLRQALGDEAETPRYIETIPRYGYRFIAQVEKDAATEAALPAPEPVTAASANAPHPAPRSSSRLHRALPWALGITTIVFVAIATCLMFLPKAPQPDVMRFSIPPPENTDLVSGGDVSLSPDGHALIFVAQSGPDKTPGLWLRRLDNLTSEPVPGTEGATLPFWSPDSQEIGFSAEGKLEKVAAAGGPPQTLCTLTSPGAAATWSRDGVILLSIHGGLYRLPDTGGTPTLVAAPDSARHESGYWFPQFLPDGRHFLFEASIGVNGEYMLEAGTLDSKSVKSLAQVTSDALYAPPGYLLYLNQGTLMARPFNARTLRLSGPATAIAQNVGEIQDYDFGFFSVSPAGVLAYQTGHDEASISQMAWFSRAGQKLGTVGQPDIYAAPALSPDGTRVAVAMGNYGERDIWVFETRRGTSSRLTFNPADDFDPAWTPDGTRILYSSDRNGQIDIYQKDANGLGSTQPVFQSKGQAKALDDLSADGRYAIYDNAGSSTSKQLWVLPLFGQRKPFVFVQGGYGALSARFSPNGRYVAYASNETGRLEVYVQTFPQQTGKWEISTSGGAEPMWRRDGKELFYLAPGDKLMAVSVSTDSDAFQPGIPRELFQAQLPPISYWRNFYVASPDGQRFLMLVPASKARNEPITMVVNWPALLKK